MGLLSERLSLTKTAADPNVSEKRKQELEWLHQYQRTEDPYALRQLKGSFMNIAKDLARRNTPRSGEVDHYQLLMKAEREFPGIFKRFNPENGGSQLHSWVTNQLTGHIHNAVKEFQLGPHTGRNEQPLVHKFKYALLEAQNEHGPNPTDEQIHAFMPNVSKDDFKKAKALRTENYLSNARTKNQEDEDDPLEFQDQFKDTRLDMNHEDDFLRMKMEEVFTPAQLALIKDLKKDLKPNVSKLALSHGMTSRKVTETIEKWKKMQEK